MIGQGLSSLIPKKENQDSEKKTLIEKKPVFSPPRISSQIKVSKENSISIKNKEAIFQIEIEKIKPNPYQPRKDFDEEELKELAESIRNYGILQPLVVSKIEKETESGTFVEYQLISGERRLRAAKIAGLEKVPVIIKNLNDEKLKLELALIENLQRSDLNPIEAARAFTCLYEEFGLTQQEIAQRVGKSREVVANTMRLLKLPLYIQEALMAGKINESQARILLSIENHQKQKEVFEAIIFQKLSVRELKEKIKEKIQTQKIVSSQDYWSKRLEEKLEAPVKIFKKGERGKIVIDFYSEEEFENLLRKIIGET